MDSQGGPKDRTGRQTLYWQTQREDRKQLALFPKAVVEARKSILLYDAES